MILRATLPLGGLAALVTWPFVLACGMTPPIAALIDDAGVDSPVLSDGAGPEATGPADASAPFADAMGPEASGPDAGADAAGCSGIPQSLKGSCVYGTDAASLGCVEYTGSTFTLADVQGACGLLSNPPSLVSSASSTPCPTGMRVGGQCIDQCGQPGESVGYNYFGTAASWGSACVDGGGYYVP